MSIRLTLHCAVLMFLFGFSTILRADPPDRVGRISFIEGAASLHGAEQPSDQWAPAELNYPLTAGTELWTQQDGRLELQIGPAIASLDRDTDIELARLDDDTLQLRLLHGSINIQLHEMPEGGMAVLTPRGQVDLLRAGTYRVESDADDDQDESTQISTLEGLARIDGPHTKLEILSGESAIISGDPASFTLSTANSAPIDDWALRRARGETTEQSTRYVSTAVTGHQDLDRYGRWSSDPDYGEVWYPADVAADWAPYRYGYWSYVAPWGWTWIDNAPWGFAPFHYGRWVYVRNTWGWCPGRLSKRPVYAPALVAFVGGREWNVAARPAVGWLPLGPRETFRPYYPVSANYLRRINNDFPGGARDIGVSGYRNQHAVTVVAAETFTHGARVHERLLPAPRDHLAQSPVIAELGHLHPVAPHFEPRPHYVPTVHSEPRRYPVYTPRPAYPPRPYPSRPYPSRPYHDRDEDEHREYYPRDNHPRGHNDSHITPKLIPPGAQFNAPPPQHGHDNRPPPSHEHEHENARQERDPPRREHHGDESHITNKFGGMQNHTE